MAEDSDTTKTLVPQIVDDQGNPLEGPEMEAVLGKVTQMSQLAQLARINKNLTRIRQDLDMQVTKGMTVTKNLDAIDTQQTEWLLQVDPYEPWATATFTNKGLDTVMVSVNNGQYFKSLVVNQIWEIDFKQSEQRLWRIDYYCAKGEKATLTADGKY